MMEFARRETGITALFFDVGGVLLSNGWDRRSRRHCIETFGLDWEEFQDRHEFVSEAFETGKMTLDDYLDRTVFYRARDFSRKEFVDGMYEESHRLSGTLEFVSSLRGRYLLATLNNESRELSDYRIEQFGLRKVFDVFLTSSYVGVKKPQEGIFRIALDITQRRADESVFIDDRPLNLESAKRVGLHTIAFDDVAQLTSELAALGVE
jgi:putative hydrolase of the HAD superfamily